MAENLKIRLKDNKFVCTNGDIVEIPFSVLFNECEKYFREEYNGLKISCVLSKVIEKRTGCELIINDLRKNEIFQRLEKEMISTPCYKERKEQITQKSDKQHSARRAYEKQTRNGVPDLAYRYKKLGVKMLRISRSRFYHGNDE